jgi:N-acetylmuramoyl-L-alanine amidase
MKITNLIASALNLAVVASFVSVGVYQVKDARAEQILSSISSEGKACLHQNIYWEAGNQSTAGKVAVAWVTLNRVDSPKYPNTICGVVKQGRKNSDGSMKKHKCQFSWYCDGKSDKISKNVIEQRAWEDSKIVSTMALLNRALGKMSPVKEAVMYHADYVSPYWKTSYSRVTQIEDHIFYQ